MTQIFTKEGISGRAMSELSCEAALKIGRALALILQNRTGRRTKAVIGRDTRLSGELLTVSFAAGFCSAGSDSHLLGVVPTPAVSYLTQKYGADVGVMLTASHNSYEFNGIRFFDSRGFSLSDDITAEIARLVTEAPNEMRLSGGEEIGSLVTEKNAEWDYVRGLIKQIDGDLSRMRIAIDCANGSACGTAEKFFRGIGAGVSLINNEPDGRNINSGCGTTDLSALQKYVVDSPISTDFSTMHNGRRKGADTRRRPHHGGFGLRDEGPAEAFGKYLRSRAVDELGLFQMGKGERDCRCDRLGLRQ